MPEDNNYNNIDKSMTYIVSGIVLMIMGFLMIIPFISLYLGNVNWIIGRVIGSFVVILGISFLVAGILCINQGIKYKKIMNNEQTEEDETTIDDFEHKIVNLVKIAGSVFMLTFTLFWFGIIGFITYITIAQREFFMTLFTIPFWIMGFHVILKIPSDTKEK